MQTPLTHVDLLIVGAGPVGALLALSLADSGLRIMVVEARDGPSNDQRQFALAYPSYQYLQQHQVWPEAYATPIHQVQVSQHQSKRTTMCLDCSDIGLPSLGYVLPYSALLAAVDSRLKESATIHYISATTVVSIQSLAAYAVVQLRQQQRDYSVTARLVVLADGGKLLASLGVRSYRHDYQQQAWMAEVTSNTAHHGRAYEYFSQAGPMAWLPQGDAHALPGRHTLIWTRTTTPGNAELPSAAALLAELKKHWPERSREVLQLRPLACFPLVRQWLRQPTAQRLVMIGNAAQTLHPFAAQGYNLGLRDVRALQQLICTTPPAQLGNTDMLRRYQRLRCLDSTLTMALSDSLLSILASNQTTAIRLRQLGLQLLASIKPLRRALANRLLFGEKQWEAH